MNDITKAKLIMFDAFKNEIMMKRDLGEKGAPEFGEKSKAVQLALIHLEGELEKQIKRLSNGESIYEIVPGLEDEHIYDKEAT